MFWIVFTFEKTDMFDCCFGLWEEKCQKDIHNNTLYVESEPCLTFDTMRVLFSVCHFHEGCPVCTVPCTATTS